MNFIKMNTEDTEKLYNFLKELKKNNWMVYDPNILLLVYDWHVKITGFICAYEGKDYGDDVFCYMARDLCLYFKEDIKQITKIKCKKCRRIKPVDDFLGKNICRICRKKTRSKYK